MSGATINPERRGTKMAARYRTMVAAGGEIELRLRLDGRRATRRVLSISANDTTDVSRRAKAKPTNSTPASSPRASDEELAIMRQAYAGLIWSQQFYHFNLERWLDGDPTQPTPPASPLIRRNMEWRHLNSHDILVMPDTWEYPWFAAWDLAFHCMVMARIDPAAAKHQLLLLFREWYMHPNGQLPAYEWDFSDVNPPVHAWAALAVFRIDGSDDFDFLARVFQKLLINFTWWVNRKDALDNNVFEGGFLGTRQHRCLRPLRRCRPAASSNSRTAPRGWRNSV